ncbi:methyltransferase-domain-containing protein [Emericellopsis atlantica]|uniref:Ribosomal RNA-processing protein 8 n=1 Tax=Emericellopsis atlantica TaxID=2614577 RepID=A0A9P7ZWT6_9HYPO|nr:methyltransferase-domain-containing protein [Emericellopsis atlantica]KAG9259301.1 methyltransferase-domain-containing protein [Emericellopsis atlantica]
MFKVPGWSVSADKLKPQTSSNDLTSNSAQGPSEPTKSKKRKRPGRSQAVTADNVADLFESVIEGRKAEGSNAEKPSKKQKKDKKPKPDVAEGAKPAAQGGSPGPSPATTTKMEEKPKKDKKQKKQQQQKKDVAAPEVEADKTVVAAPGPPPLPPAPAKLTPLQASMRQKLISARFRHLNETLYTRPSAEALALFAESPEMFDEYHEGFRRQVTVWPENPVDSFLGDIRRRAKVKPPRKGDKPQEVGRQALPRTEGICTIADLGCGDARLAAELQKEKKKLKVQINSYDLQSPSPLVTKADIANLPLEDDSVNVAIFCLALMGTNWVDFIEEAYRILHWKGELWVAEIKSRFGPVRNKNAPVTHSVGNRKKMAKKAKAGEEEGAGFENDLAVEVDGEDDRRRETDVSAFVEVLRKRGFVLQGEKHQAIDLSNKMFVKMHFTKGAAPVKGKGVKAQEKRPLKKGITPKRDLSKMDEDENEGDEATVLKPCVYKIR